MNYKFKLNQFVCFHPPVNIPLAGGLTKDFPIAAIITSQTISDVATPAYHIKLVNTNIPIWKKFYFFIKEEWLSETLMPSQLTPEEWFDIKKQQTQ